MKFEDMKLTYGYPLQLQTNGLSGQPERFSCRLIGCLPGRTILVSVPKIAGKLVRFRPNQKIVIRLMVDNGIGIFASAVEVQTAEPYPILHISYPENVSFKGIRGATRVAIEQPVAILNQSHSDKKVYEGAILDISITGARIEVDSIIGEIGDRLALTMQINIADIMRDLTVDAVIRSCVQPAGEGSNPGGVVTYGIEFVESNEDRRLLLYAYVYAQIGSEEMIN